MLEHDPIQTDIRKLRWKRRFGPKPVCVLCRIRSAEVLMKVHWSLVHSHHVLGKNNDPNVTVPVCLNCHAILTEMNRRYGVSMETPANLLEHLIAVLRALGVFLPVLGESLFKLADQLSRFMKALDEKYPEWRNMKEGK